MEESSEKVELAQIYAIEVSELKRLLAEAKADVKAEVKADVKAKAAPLHLSKERLIELSKESRPGSLVELQLARYKFVNGLSKEGLWSSLSEASTQELRNFLAVFNFKISKELSTNSQYQKSQGSLCRYFVGPECMTKVCLLSESQLAEDARVVFREVEVTSQISGATSLVLVSKYCFPARQELIVVDSRPFMFVVTSYPHILYNLNQYMVNNAQIVNQEILIEAFDKILHDLALSVFYLQASGFIHGWINVNTIFYRADTGSWVLGDFSQAQQIHKNSYINDDQLHARMKGDVYQLGEVLVQFLLNDMSQQISKKSALDQDIYLAMIKNLTSNEAFQKPLIILQNDIYRQTAVLQHMIAPAPEKRYDILEVCLSLILNKQFLQPFAVINELQQQKFQQPEEGRVHISTKTLSSISELFEFQRPAQTQLQPGAQVQPGKSPKSQERTITQIRMGEKLIYEGEINARGMPQGEGVFYIGQDNIWVYSGRFSEGYFDGEGTITLNRKVICFGVFEFGLNKQYLEKLEVGAFTQLCKEYSEFLIKYSAERKWLELACERNAELKARNELVFGMNYSSDKQDIVRVLNTLVKFMDADITTILFNFKNSQTSSVKEFQQIEITTVEGQLVRFRFNFGYVIKEEEFFILLDKSRRLVHLKLNMGFTHVSDKFFYGMSSNDKLSQLVELNLQKVYMITDDGLISFLQSSISHNLRVLDISFTQITDRSVLVLASPEACWASQLVQLRMRNCLDITEKSLVEYVTSPNAQCIQLLDFSGLDLTDSLIYEISYSSYMGKLASLYVNECPKITFESLGHLGKSPFMLFLSTLELSKCLKQQLSAEQAPGFIKSLLLQNQMKKKFQNMTSSQQLQNLKCLNFYSTGIQDVHIKQLANSPFFKSLKELNISRCEQLTDSSIYHIAHSNNFTNLHVLDMQDLKLITGESLKQLGKSKYLKKIEVLKLAGCSQLQPAVLSQSFNQVSNFLLLKQLLIDEMQFDADLLRIINFSMSTNQPQFSRFQEFQIAVDNANIFLQLHLENIIGLNSRVFRFMVNQYKEHDVVLNLAGILPLMSLQISQCQGAIYVNSVLINQQLVEDVVTQQYNRASLSQQMMEKQTAAPAPCFWTGEVLLSLNRTRIFDSLVTLNLAGMTEKMHPAVFTSIAQSRYFPNLHALVLDNTSVDDAAMQGLFQHQPTHLRLFSVRQCNLLSFEGLKCLLHKGGYDHLEQLDIRDSQAAGTEFSLNLHRFKSLRHLNDGFIQVSVYARPLLPLFSPAAPAVLTRCSRCSRCSRPRGALTGCARFI